MLKKVDVTGTSKGKGFQGGVKRWNFRTQDATHGNSLSHRVLGSIGQTKHQVVCLKVKKMAGHLGAERVTVQSLEVVRVDAERKLLLVKVLYLVLSMAMLSLSRQLKHKSRR